MDDDLRRGLDQIARGEYFEAHETLEDIWRAADAAEKDFFQGLVHVAVAWYQAGRGNRVGCERQLEKAARRLGPFAPEHRAVKIDLLLRSLERARETVLEGSLALPPPVLATADSPYGCAVVVWRTAERGREYLVLHRVTEHGPDFEGDWAWTPPSGVRAPGEDPDQTAAREVREETGLDLAVEPAGLDVGGWLIYVAEAPANGEVVLNEEHDRFLWLPVDDAERLCLPPPVGSSIREVAQRLERA